MEFKFDEDTNTQLVITKSLLERMNNIALILGPPPKSHALSYRELQQVLLIESLRAICEEHNVILPIKLDEDLFNGKK